MNIYRILLIIYIDIGVLVKLFNFFNNIIYLLNSDFYVLYYLLILISKWIYDYIFKINN